MNRQLLVQWQNMAPPHMELPDTIAARIADSILRLHAALIKKLGRDLIADPTLLMLLELFVAKIRGRKTTIKVLVLSSGVPQSTALRWIDRLEAEHLITKRANEADGRSAIVTITNEAGDLVRQALAGFAQDLSMIEDEQE